MKSAGEMKCANLNSLISCISFCGETFEESGLIACGSYDSKVGVYDYYSGEAVALFNIQKDIEREFKSNKHLNLFQNARCGGVTKVI